MRKLLFAAAILVPLGLSACSTSEPTSKPADQSQQAQTLSGSLVQAYDTIPALQGASTVIARGVAGAATVEVLDGLQFTVTNVTITQAFQGGDVGATVRVRQTGTAKGTTDLSGILAQGREYLIFAWPWVLRGAPPSGQIYITGDQGVWVLDPGAASPQYRYVGAENAGLPAQLSKADVESGAFLR